jgi:hypothetical protein
MSSIMCACVHLYVCERTPQADIVEEEGKLAPGSDPNSILAARKVARPFKEADTLYVTVTVSELLQNRVVAGQWVEGDVVGLRITVYDPETSQRAQRDIPTTTASLVQVRVHASVGAAGADGAGQHALCVRWSGDRVVFAQLAAAQRAVCVLRSGAGCFWPISPFEVSWCVLTCPCPLPNSWWATAWTCCWSPVAWSWLASSSTIALCWVQPTRCGQCAFQSLQPHMSLPKVALTSSKRRVCWCASILCAMSAMVLLLRQVLPHHVNVPGDGGAWGARHRCCHRCSRGGGVPGRGEEGGPDGAQGRRESGAGAQFFIVLC